MGIPPYNHCNLGYYFRLVFPPTPKLFYVLGHLSLVIGQDSWTCYQYAP